MDDTLSGYYITFRKGGLVSSYFMDDEGNSLNPLSLDYAITYHIFNLPMFKSSGTKPSLEAELTS